MQNRNEVPTVEKLEQETHEVIFEGLYKTSAHKQLIHWQSQGQYFTCTLGQQQNPRALIVKPIFQKLEEKKSTLTLTQWDELLKHLEAIVVEKKKITVHADLLENLFTKKEINHKRKRKKPETASNIEQPSKKTKSSAEGKQEIIPEPEEIKKPTDCPDTLWNFVVAYEKHLGSILPYQQNFGAFDLERVLRNLHNNRDLPFWNAYMRAIISDFHECLMRLKNNFINHGLANRYQVLHINDANLMNALALELDQHADVRNGFNTFYCHPELALAWYHLYDLPQNHGISRIDKPQGILKLDDYLQLEEVLISAASEHPMVCKAIHTILNRAHPVGVIKLLQDKLKSEMLVWSVDTKSETSLAEKWTENNNNNIPSYYTQNNPYLRFSPPSKPNDGFKQTLEQFNSNASELKSQLGQEFLNYSHESQLIRVTGNATLLKELAHHLKHLEPQEIWGAFQIRLNRENFSLEITHLDSRQLHQMIELLFAANIISEATVTRPETSFVLN